MQLHPGPFFLMQTKIKKSELRLNDEKRQLIMIGDTIEFSNQENSQEKIRTEVTYLHHYPDFKSLFEEVKSDYPDDDMEGFVQGMYKYYTPGDELRYGALEIGIKLI
jgi:ASC-1-like (ASCH) protein